MKTYLKRVLIALGVFALSIAVLYAGWDISSRRKLAAAKERIRAAGLPLTVDDMRPPSVPDSDNAALVMVRLDALIEALPPVNGLSFKQWNADFSSRHVMYLLDETAAKELALQFDSPHMQAVLALIREAVDKAGYDAKGDYFTRATAAQRLHEATKLLSWDVRLSARLRDTETACQGVWDMLTLAEHLSNEAGMLARTSRFGILMGVARELEQLSAQDSIPPAWAKKFADRLAALDRNWGWARAIDGERILLGQSTFEELLAAKFDRKKLGEQADSWRDWFHQQRYIMPQWIRTEYADYLDHMREYRIAASTHYQDFTHLERVLAKLERTNPILPGRLVSLAVTSDLGSILNAAVMWNRARMVRAQVGLALERYRVAKGGYPAALAELAPEFIPSVPADVFTGKPLIYRLESGGALTYSVGPNLKDDGGIMNKDDEKDDIGWASGAAAVRKYAVPPPPPADADGDEP